MSLINPISIINSYVIYIQIAMSMLLLAC